MTLPLAGLGVFVSLYLFGMTFNIFAFIGLIKNHGVFVMKLLHLTYHFEFSDQIEKILDAHDIRNYVRYARVAGKDRDGRHDGTKVFPGHSSVVQAQEQFSHRAHCNVDLKSFS